MARNTRIEWAHHTFNAWRGCDKVSPGCDHCYADTMSHRNPEVLGEWGKDGRRGHAAEGYWRQPLAWDRAAELAGERHRVFCLSLGDMFENRPDLREPRLRLFDLIVQTPHLDWLLLTKRPKLIRRLIGEALADAGEPGSLAYIVDPLTRYARRQALWKMLVRWVKDDAPANVWMGVSVEDQERADERIPVLMRVPAVVRFLSVEPLLGPVNLRPYLPHEFNREPHCEWCEDCIPSTPGKEWWKATRADHHGPFVQWVIVGGESGSEARPMHLAWARRLRDDCAAADVPMLFKQWGEWAPLYGETQARKIILGGNGHARTMGAESLYDDDVFMARIGKHETGRLLDGRLHDEIPTPAPAETT